MSRLLSSLPVGALVKEDSFIYNGDTPIFRILEHGHIGDPAGSTALEFRDIVTLRCFDAQEDNSGNKGKYGWTRYDLSNIHQWLNSDAGEGQWYSQPQGHITDNPPSSSYVMKNSSNVAINPYDTDAGFLSYFPQVLKENILTANKPSYYTTQSHPVNAKLWLLSNSETDGVPYSYAGTDYPEGSVYSYYAGTRTNYSKRKKLYANEAAKGNYSDSNSYGRWFTRSHVRYGATEYVLQVLNWDGNDAPTSYPYDGSIGISPAFCVSSQLKVTDTPVNGVYSFVWNQTPTISPASTNYGNVTAPPSITTTITDPDGDAFTYTVKLNGTTKASGSATGTKTFAIDTAGYWPLMALGINTITVQATDSQGATTSATYTMNKTNSAAPVPTTDLVNNTRKETSFYIGFQIGLDADGDSQTVVAQVSDSSDMSNPTEFSGVEKEVAGAWLPVQTLTNADVGARLRIQVTNQTVGDTIYVRLKDTDSGSGSPVYTSTYAIVIGSVLEFDTLPISRTEKPSLVVAYLNKTMPADATLTMYACNNANDGAPTWEAITEGETHQFTNKTKTAQNWAVSVKTSITAGATAGEISVSAVGLGVL